jgi:YHS domain-containing protein
MKTRLAHGVIGCLAVAVMLAATPGCRKEKPAQEESAKKEVEAEKDVDTKTAVEAKLAEADEFDGKTDKVVSKCASCTLGMDGKSEHALEVSGYKLHFCSEDCKTGFGKDTTKAILALKIPKD